MPELPEIEAHAERLTELFGGAELERFTALSFTALKTFSPDPTEAVGAPLGTVGRRGKFLLMPFHHSEQLADQQLVCALFAAFDDADTKEYAHEHRDVVARFGRFPHRNEVLGRPCSDDELEYLKDARRYGQ